MVSKYYPKKKILSIGAIIVAAAVATPPAAIAGDWGISLNLPFFRVRAHDGYYYYDNDPYDYNYGYRYKPNRRYYYPSYHRYEYNPVEERDVYEEEHVHRDGRLHSETTVEDRHSSFFSPGRNEAITPPRTTVRREYGPGYEREVERTDWIGADGRPHSTTEDRITTTDRYGNVHTETQVDLKSKSDQRSEKDRDQVKRDSKKIK